MQDIKKHQNIDSYIISIFDFKNMSSSVNHSLNNLQPETVKVKKEK